MATILVVDDLAANRKVLVTLLRHQGHRVLEAADGGAALAAARSEGPDLVITDVLMPVLDGYGLVRELRLDPALRSIPVIFYTAHYGEREARNLALSSGVSHILTKPVEPEEALKVVAEALAGERPARGDAVPLAPDFDREHLRLITDKLSATSEDLEAANARLRALVNIGLDLASERDLHRLLENVCVAARDLFGATYVTLGILEPGGRALREVVTSGIDPAHAIKSGDAPMGVLAMVTVDRRTIRGENPDGDPSALGLPPGHPDARAFLASPVASPALVYGWICLVRNEGQPFSDDDEQLVAALSGQLGRIYENGYFYTIAKKRAEELEREVVQREQAVAALQAADERMRFALEHAGIGIWDMDYKTGVLTWSEVSERQYGMAPGTFDGTFEAFIERVHPEDRPQLQETIGNAMKSSADFSTQHRAVWPDGPVRWIDGAGRILRGENGEPVRGVGITRDVTERRTLELQFQQAQKMEAVGRLAGGVAHDFNNLLTVILGHCELVLEDLAPTDPRRRDIEEIAKAGNSATGLTRQLLAFSRKQIIEPRILDVNEVVANLRGMVARLIGEDVRVVMSLRPALGRVKADPGQVEQIVLNLAVNARDAMPNGGTLTIETANVELDDHYAKLHLGVTPGSYVSLTVSDTGTGITPEVQARLFEPFFTTKEVGKGTGLGLATVHGIVSRSGGSVRVYSEIGRGTSLHVYFPIADGAADTDTTEAAAPKERAGTQTVLVVDDAEGVRELAKRLLQRQGYTVHVAANATEALQQCERHPIDVLLTDVVMPGATGPELTRQLAEQWPALKVIYMSGYTEEAISHHGVLNPGIAFVHKPFTSETLGRKLREVLGR